MKAQPFEKIIPCCPCCGHGMADEGFTSDALEYLKKMKDHGLERYETRLMFYKLIKWAKSVESSKAPKLIENCENILAKWGSPTDALK